MGWAVTRDQLNMSSEFMPLSYTGKENIARIEFQLNSAKQWSRSRISNQMLNTKIYLKCTEKENSIGG